MKQLILLFTFVVFRAIAQDTTFTKIFHRLQDNIALTTTISRKTISGNYVIAGHVGNGHAAFIQKLDSVGNEIWVRRFTKAAIQSDDFKIYHISETADSNLLLGGVIKNDTQNQLNPFIAKMNQNGDTLWTRSFSAVGNSVGCYEIAITEGTNDEYYMTWSEFGVTDLFIAKYDLNGNLLLSAKYPVVNEYQVKGAAFDSVSNKLFIVASDYNSPYSAGTFCIDQLGNYQWGKILDNVLFGQCRFYNSNLNIATRFPGSSGLGLTRISANSDLDWTYRYSTSSWGSIFTDNSLKIESSLNGEAIIYEAGDPSLWGVTCNVDSAGLPVLVSETAMILTGVHPTTENGYFLLGNGPMYGIKSNTTPHYGVVKTDSLMNALDCFWSTTSSNLTVESPITSNWNTTISGTPIVGSNPIFYDTLMIYSEPGCVRFLGDVLSLPELVFEVYPNPAREHIQFQTSQEGTYEIEILDITGKTVKNVHFKGKEIKVKLISLEYGVYLYRINSKDERVATGRFIKY